MARKRVGQLGLGDGVVAGRRGRTPDQLERISGLIDWGGIERILSPVEPKSTGKGMAGWPTLVLFKALLLQRWYRPVGARRWRLRCRTVCRFLRFCGACRWMTGCSGSFDVLALPWRRLGHQGAGGAAVRGAAAPA